MSYRRTYHGEIHGSVTGRVSYPASEKGGTTSVTLSYSEPFMVNIDVDTVPVDQGIAECRKELDSLEGSIKAGGAMQVRQKSESTRRVVKATVEGFGNLIFSEVDQKLVALSAKIQAASALLLAETQEGEKRELQFTKDFVRIKERYSSLFDTLNRDLDRRIRALDESVFKLVRADFRERLSAPMRDGPARTALFGNELSPAILRISSSLAKRRVLELISSIKSYLETLARARAAMARVLTPEQLDSAREVCLPVLFVERDEGDCLARGIVAPEGSSAPTIRTDPLLSDMSGRDYAPPGAEDRELVERGFMELVSRDFDAADPDQRRIADLTARLMRSNAWLSAL